MDYIFTWLERLVQLLLERGWGISVASRLGSSLHFFIYDIVKIMILLGIMIFLISYLRSYFPPEKTKKILERFSGVSGHVMASLLGIVTPFCSCSSVPIFIGFIEAGIPLGVTFSFVITSPIVNEAAFAVLLAAFGWRIAVVYVVTGVIIGIIGGIVIDLLALEKWVEKYVYQLQLGKQEIKKLNRQERVRLAWNNVKEIVGRIWFFLIIGIGIGAIIHGWAPAPVLAKYAGPDNPLAVLIGVLVGIPLYSNALGTIPIAEALIHKGVGIGTALSFMMATTALSLPAMILLRKVIKVKLLAVFVTITGLAIIVIGYFFNIIADFLI